MKCPNCNSEVRDGVPFCNSCGTRLDTTKVKKEETPANEQVEENTVTTSDDFIPVSSDDDSGFFNDDENKNESPDKFIKITEEKPEERVNQFIPANGNNVSDESNEIKESETKDCPFCGNKIPKNKFFCTNCGSRLDNDYVSDARAKNTIPAPVEKKAVNSDDRTVYLDAYFHGKYQSAKNGTFSFGTLVFSYIWLFFYKLYGPAFKLFFILLLTDIVGGAVMGLFAFFKINYYLIFVGYIVIKYYIIISYAKEFNAMRLEKANATIDKIIVSSINEDDRIQKCRIAGNPHFILMAVYLGFSALCGIILFFLITSVGILSTLMVKTGYTTKQHAKEYIADLEKKLEEREIKPVKGTYKQGGYYYILINSGKSNTPEFPLSVENSSGDNGYIFIDYTSSEPSYYICLTGISGNDKYYIAGKEDELDSATVSSDGICNISDYSQYKPVKLARKDY